jgi:hypothetical protein
MLVNVLMKQKQWDLSKMKKHVDQCQICGDFTRVNTEGRCDLCQRTLEHEEKSLHNRPPHIPPDDDDRIELGLEYWDDEY